jgi:cardiolipin synthase
MVFWIVVSIAGVLAVVAVLSAVHALLYKRDPRAQLAWLLTILLLPAFGAVAYWMFGVNRIRRLGRRMRGLPEVLPPLPSGSREREYPHTPLAELVALCDRVTRQPLTQGNDIRVLEDGEGAYPAMLDAIAGARRSLCLSTYIFDGDDVGRRFADALHAAVERGVEVRVLVDGIGEKYSTVSIFRWLGGVPSARFNPMRLVGRAAAYLNLRTHRKILVADGTRGFTGGMNIGERHLAARTENEERVRDLHFDVRGPVVPQMLAAFIEDWHFAAGERLSGPAWSTQAAEDLPSSGGTTFARTIVDGPDEDFEKLHWILLGALACAKRRVSIMTPYFIPGRALIAALGTAALRGVEVSVVLPAKNNLRFVHYATLAYLWELLQQGVHIHYQPAPFVHTKYLLVDDDFNLVGSSNLDPRSLRLNFELNLEVYDEGGVGAALRAHFDAARAASREISLDDVLSTPLGERIRNAAAKLFSPYL